MRIPRLMDAERRRTDGRTDGRTGRQADRQTARNHALIAHISQQTRSYSAGGGLLACNRGSRGGERHEGRASTEFTRGIN